MCEVGERWERAHFWLHNASSKFDAADWKEVEKLAAQILDLLNDSEVSNAVKLVAVAHIAMIGVDHIDNAKLVETEVSGTVH